MVINTRRGFIVTGLAASAFAASPDFIYAQVTVQTITFKRLGDVELKADVHGSSDGAPRPVIINIHGGALILGNRSMSARPGSLLEMLLKAGYVVVSMDYRLAPSVKLPAIIEDVQDAYRWAREKGPSLCNTDPKRIAVMGGSAGGYLTLMTGFCVEPRPKALVSFWGYGDIAGDWYSKPDAFYRQQPLVSKEDAEKEGGGKLYLYLRQNGLWPKQLTGFDPATEPRKFDPYCPLRNVTAKYPPTMLVHGTKDTDVPYEQSVLMDRELTAKRVEHEFVTVPDGGHGLGNVPREVVAKMHERVVAFLDGHLK